MLKFQISRVLNANLLQSRANLTLLFEKHSFNNLTMSVNIQGVVRQAPGNTYLLKRVAILSEYVETCQATDAHNSMKG